MSKEYQETLMYKIKVTFINERTIIKKELHLNNKDKWIEQEEKDLRKLIKEVRIYANYLTDDELRNKYIEEIFVEPYYAVSPIDNPNIVNHKKAFPKMVRCINVDQNDETRKYVVNSYKYYDFLRENTSESTIFENLDDAINEFIEDMVNVFSDYCGCPKVGS